ncbi:GspE/PulE family protein [Paucibacter sp. R3-3]|uniref:GspE/PulE family protein n=1 Tax=Roseateles agri TaxID=3098619 RepID=A0ABU5DAP5_9BURK|nr:GspE/PulE family protein [Paucibacter sp. R3-3]MDY0743347.1 GspE/PulE family protein [Paucibacter sp. R3-3]
MSDIQDLKSAIAAARRESKAGRGVVLDLLLRALGCAPDQLAQRLRAEAGVGAIFDSEGWREDFGRLSMGQARELKAVVLASSTGASQLLAMADPWDEAALRRVARVLGATPPVAAASRQVLGRVLDKVVAIEDESPAVQLMETSDGVEGPVVQFVDAALRSGYARGASDIHFECSRSGVVVRLRKDGVMQSFARLDDARRAEEVISRIKVLAQLDITEKRLPQDGRFRVALEGNDVDLRVSIIPSVFGEDAVLRLLDKAQLRDPRDQVSLDLLGFDADSAQRIRDLAELPHGMLLVTGPTGSGKTTTVYASLSEVNNGIEKIITIEDPVEYELPGVLQVPVNERKGLTFAKGLRSILRHDPDRILVGEIRDAETAEIAVQSALTGHQVFTTVHANSIFDVTGRFKHFGLDMFGFMAALNGVIVQRLVRCLCPICSDWRPVAEREAHWLANMGFANTAEVPQVRGCAACDGTGYKGRRVIAEVHSVDDAFRDLVTSQSPVSALREHVYSRNVRTLGQQGADLIRSKITSTEEIKRVVGWQ